MFEMVTAKKRGKVKKKISKMSKMSMEEEETIDNPFAPDDPNF